MWQTLVPNSFRWPFNLKLPKNVINNIFHLIWYWNRKLITIESTYLKTSTESKAFSKFHSTLIIKAVGVLNNISNKCGIFQGIWIIKCTFPSVRFEVIFSSWATWPVKITIENDKDVVNKAEMNWQFSFKNI